MGTINRRHFLLSQPRLLFHDFFCGCPRYNIVYVQLNLNSCFCSVHGMSSRSATFIYIELCVFFSLFLLGIIHIIMIICTDNLLFCVLFCCCCCYTWLCDVLCSKYIFFSLATFLFFLIVNVYKHKYLLYCT